MPKFTRFPLLGVFALLVASLSTIPFQHATAEALTVSTLSGRGGAGTFSFPTSVSVSPDGSIYVADKDNFQIKKIVGAVVSVFATTAVGPYLDLENSFCGVYVKSVDEIFAKDCKDSKVFKYNKNGNLLRTYITNIASSQYIKDCNDWGGELTVDKLGGIFLSDECNKVIIRIDETSGLSSVYVGLIGMTGSTNGDSTVATFYIPRGLAVDSQNNLYVADPGNGMIRKITPQRVTSTIQSMPCVQGVGVDSQDKVFGITERWCGAIIYKVGTGDIFNDSAKSIDRGVNGSIIGMPAFGLAYSGMSIDRFGPSPTENIYIADAYNSSIKVFSPTGVLIKTIGSENGFGVTNEATGTPNQIYDFPSQTFPLDDGTYLVSDNFTVRHLSATGQILKVTRLTQGCYFSAGVTFTPDGTFFCSNGSTVMARFIDGTWTTIGTGTAGRKDGRASVAQFERPEGVATWQDDVYVADVGSRQIKKISRIPGTKDFEVRTVLGTGVWTGAPDVQPRAKATFAGPTKITIDKNGNIFIADGGVDSIFKTSLVQENDVTKIATGLKSWPSSITVDNDNVVYVSTYGGTLFRIRNNIISFIGGKMAYGLQDGTLDNAIFNRPTGLSIDKKGDLLVADRENQRIRKVALGGAVGLNIYSAKTLSSYLKSSNPGAPTVSIATQTGDSSATVAFTAPASDGGSTITSYTATSSPSGAVGSLSQAGSGTITVTGLLASTTYTFTVYATNAAGNSLPSSSSNRITTTAPVPPFIKGLDTQQENILEKGLINNNEAGLISKWYQMTKSALPVRSTFGLPLGSVELDQTINFNWEFTQKFDSLHFLKTFTGYITWPGVGQQSRTIYTYVAGGMYLEIDTKTIIDAWYDSPATVGWPFNKSKSVTLEGGKQYPIKIWYYNGTRLGLSPTSAALKLYWSVPPNTFYETNIIDAKYFAPKLLKASAVAAIAGNNIGIVEAVPKPTKPTLPLITFNLNLINLNVLLPSGTTSVYLFSPELGITKLKPIIGEISDSKANFELSINSQFAGKKGVLQLVGKNASGESDPLKIPVTVPKIQNKPSTLKTVAPKPPVVPKQPQITCFKGATKRVYEGTVCPPGFTKS